MGASNSSAAKGPPVPASFNADKCKVQLNLLISRLRLRVPKETNLAKQERPKVAALLREDKEHEARIKVESMIRSDYKIESFETLRNYAEVLVGRLTIMKVNKDLKPEIAEAVTAIAYAGLVMGNELDELRILLGMIIAKYGKAYIEEVHQNKETYINARFLKVIDGTQTPDQSVIVAYLEEIAKNFSVEYRPPELGAAPLPLSATTGLTLPEPGMPMPGAVPPAPIGTYEVLLTKRHPAGFGVKWDAENVVTDLTTDEASAKMARGDKCVAFNGTAVDESFPVKSKEADCDEGHVVTFTMVKATVAEPAAGASLYSAEALGGTTAGYDANYPAVGACVSEPSTAPVAMPSDEADTADDALAKRLAALKG